jgi:hypothetical protein
MLFRQRVWIVRLLATALFALFLLTAFRRGWTQSETDFPGYYTAAVLVRKHAPLRKFYEWPWFQREMNYAGVETQLGAYAAQTPLTMLPIVPFASYPVQTAKRLWLVLNLLLLAATVWMLARVTSFRFEEIAILAFCGYAALDRNFVLGQYYVCLLFLLTLSFFLLQYWRPTPAGISAGIAFGLKLYGGPLLVYFLVKRNWRAFAAMLSTMTLLGVLAISCFGWSDIHYYLTQVLPRSLEGGPIDPYHPANQTLSTLLRQWFMFEPELNPHPFSYSPTLFFFFRPFLSLAILAMTLLGLYCTSRLNERRDFAWFTIMILLLSTSVASYTFIILLLPTALLLADTQPSERVLLIAAYILLIDGIPFLHYYPKLWILLALFLWIGIPYWRRVPLRFVIPVLATVAVFAAIDANRHLVSLADEPITRFEPTAMQPGVIFSDRPVITKAGLFFNSLGHDHYELRWMHAGYIEELLFDGEALYPQSRGPDGPIYFELVSHGQSRQVAFDPGSRSLTSATLPPPVPGDWVVSPDGKWIAFASEATGTHQVWLRNLATGHSRAITGGNCNNSSPAWELDSQSIVFASDCQRAMGVPALYRARLASITLP